METGPRSLLSWQGEKHEKTQLIHKAGILTGNKTQGKTTQLKFGEISTEQNYLYINMELVQGLENLSQVEHTHNMPVSNGSLILNRARIRN